MKIALFKESRAGETRVALTPDAVAALVGDGWEVVVQRGAGVLAHFLDEVARLPEGSLHLSFLSPLLALDVVRALNERRVTVVSFDLLPRISRAQYMDALSSQATVSGYRAALAGATYFDRFFPLLTTAAGTIRPAKVLVMGVGVAGLQAIATSRRLGAKVRAYDVRAALAGEVANADIVITTAAVPGRKAPILLTSAMVDGMSEGALVIDMAADGGGNCELTRVGEVVERHGVRVVGLANPPSQMGAHASFMYANNVLKQLAPDWTDEVVVGVTVASDGHVHHAPTAEALGV